jgi:hypothetical protein
MKTINKSFRAYLKGIGSIAVIQPPYHAESLGYALPGDTDADAIMGDWAAVGEDIWSAVRTFKIDKENHVQTLRQT